MVFFLNIAMILFKGAISVKDGWSKLKGYFWSYGRAFNVLKNVGKIYQVRV